MCPLGFDTLRENLTVIFYYARLFFSHTSGRPVRGNTRITLEVRPPMKEINPNKTTKFPSLTREVVYVSNDQKMEKLLLPPANEVCEGYVFTPVCQSFCSRGKVCLSACWDSGPPKEQTHPRADTPQSRHPPGADPYSPLSRHPHPPPRCMLGDTGSKRAVRILLECILVVGDISGFRRQSGRPYLHLSEAMCCIFPEIHLC